MDSFTLVDGIVALVVIISGLLAFARGITREALAILGWIIAAVVAFAFAGSAVPLVKQIPGLSSIIGDSCELSLIVAFAAVFALVLVISSLFTPLFASLVQRSALGPIDQGAGFLFGIARGILLVALAFLLYNVVLDAQDIGMIENSRSAKVFGNMVSGLEGEDPEEALGWLTTKYEALTGTCTQQ